MGITVKYVFILQYVIIEAKNHPNIYKNDLLQKMVLYLNLQLMVLTLKDFDKFCNLQMYNFLKYYFKLFSSLLYK